MENLSRVIVLVLFLIFLAFPSQAANPLDVVINEVAWMGTKISYNDEWAELYNNSDSLINLEGWILKTADGTLKINLTGTIAAKSFYLLERTDDNTVPDIPADQIYTGALGNTGEKLELYDGSGNLIDLVDCSSGWFAGDNKTKQTMERKNSQLPGSDPDNWQTSQNPGGTPKAKNSLGVQIEKQLQESPQIKDKAQTVEEKPVEPEPQPQIYPSGIVLNEILPSPEGPDEKEEWIEIFNQNNFEVDLSGWQIADTEGKTTIFIFSTGTKISAKGFLVLSRPTTKITLNNDGDGLNLIQPDGKIIDSVTYKKAPQGQSFNRIDSKWAWSTTITPGSANVIPTLISEAKKTELSKEEVKEAPSETKEESLKKELAAIGSPAQIFQEKTWAGKQIPIFIIALATAIFSGIIILTLKGKLQNKRNLLK